MFSRNRHAGLLALTAAVGLTLANTAADIPAPVGGTSREPQRRNSSRDRHRVADPERERRAAEKRERKAAKRLREQTTTEGHHG